ncbi:hypothetical protein O53_4675 [Microcystis aeruginosa TAIHU98]|uniref:Uncharacterized protein n=1 Tax=Microcystis aeruginosa TAIHU98 TaxID=1134457 RepID=L7E244_MICAE|nr:hypothetical protein O53_4675 [Microcystis aeruginosa TAIHU98]ODV38571.1 hypothetical protein BFG60_1915 [Microcystis aeruginosa NIES-98]CCI08839.1 hypothetical protein MICAD_3540002 [Microcystis aeruginosa PCC 7941]
MFHFYLKEFYQIMPDFATESKDTVKEATTFVNLGIVHQALSF